MADTPKKKPFGFEVSYELFNAREERLRDVLLIENPGSGQSLRLSIVNALVQQQEAITLHRISDVSASRYHFRLHFAAGTLAPREASTVGADWAVLRAGNADGSTDLFLAWRSPDVTLAPGESLTAELYGMSALPSVGAEVVMALKWPTPDTQTSAAAALTIESRGPGQGSDYELEAQHPLGVRNRRGQPDCPLRAGFVGANQVLNVDNAQGTLRLRLFNAAAPGSANGALRFVSDVNEPTRTSRLVVALPVGTVADAPWALGTEQQVKDITFSTLADFSRSAAVLSADGTHVEWTFTPSKDVTLAPRAAWELQLGKLVTLHPDGPAELRLRYENVPGFWDGERVCVLDKAPLVFGQKVDASHDYSGQVGIGNATPAARVHVRGGHVLLHDANTELRTFSHFVFRSDLDKSNDTASVRFLKKDETSPLMELSANGDLGTKGNVNAGSNLTTRGSINADGSLSVKGNMSADGGLMVKGRIKDKTGWLVPPGTIVCFGGDTAPEGWLKCDGTIYKRADYTDLYAAIKDAYKKDADNPQPGATEFRVPTLKGRVPLGLHSGHYDLGMMGGEYDHRLTIEEMPVHDHFVEDPGHSHEVKGRNDEPKDDNQGRHPQNWVSSYKQFPFHTERSSTGVTLRTNGGGGSHNNMQPYTTVNFIIKY